MPVFLALLFLSFLPCIIRTIQGFLLDHMSAIVNQKFNELYLQGYQPLQNCPENYFEGPSRMPQEPEDPAPHNAPCQQESAKETDALPQFLILSPYLHYY
jgi:hypothetical protein